MVAPYLNFLFRHNTTTAQHNTTQLMFSAWRRLTGGTKQDDKSSAQQFPQGVLPIGESMQKKYAKGVQYNLKIILKGDRNTGKTTLFHRLNGKPFRDEYIPTQEIQVTNVNWNYQVLFCEFRGRPFLWELLTRNIDNPNF